MYGSTGSSNSSNIVQPTTILSYDTEIGQDRISASGSTNRNNNQSGYTRLVTFMVVVLSLLAVVTLSAGAYVGSSSKNINSSSSIDSTITTTTTETSITSITSIIPDNTGIINTITESEFTFNPTPTALYPTESPSEELDINKALNIVKEIKSKKEVKESQNKGKIIENSEILNERR